MYPMYNNNNFALINTVYCIFPGVLSCRPLCDFVSVRMHTVLFLWGKLCKQFGDRVFEYKTHILKYFTAHLCMNSWKFVSVTE